MTNQQSGDNENLLRHIASTVGDILDRMVTKEDIGHLVTKEEFEPVREQVNHLTRQVIDLTGQVTDQTGQMTDLTGRMNDLTGRMDDLTGQVTGLTSQVTGLTGQVTDLTGRMTDLTGRVNHLTEQVAFLGGQVEDVRDRMATKEDLARVESRLERKIEVETTAVRGDIEQVHLRTDAIEKALSSRLDHFEADVSRMRSVLYLLVKDKPDMLRLLGQAPPAGG